MNLISWRILAQTSFHCTSSYHASFSTPHLIAPDLTVHPQAALSNLISLHTLEHPVAIPSHCASFSTPYLIPPHCAVYL
eukprot:1161864-Pelagomonas_calceolata.AAC.23